HESTRARQADAESLTGRISITHDRGDVGDTWALVYRHDFDAAPLVVVDERNGDVALLGVLDDVARDFGYGRGDDGEVAAREAGACRQRAPLLPGRDDVGEGANADVNLFS